MFRIGVLSMVVLGSVVMLLSEVIWGMGVELIVMLLF